MTRHGRRPERRPELGPRCQGRGNAAPRADPAGGGAPPWRGRRRRIGAARRGRRGEAAAATGPLLGAGLPAGGTPSHGTGKDRCSGRWSRVAPGRRIVPRTGRTAAGSQGQVDEFPSGLQAIDGLLQAEERAGDEGERYL
ncbi:hypothetical protein PVAP13_9KG273813 [Panicum virgatum]|uniref:Uncharacterized protein n=1 Tax=Panicum virgatum TaxID=38727 RepID=A0A8T0NKI5_PANVG|nr:hypothetical protein PVAP13_9KG273813 [Panicum virgatum]